MDNIRRQTGVADMAAIRIKVCIDLHLDGARELESLSPLFIVSPRVIERARDV